MIGEQYGSGGHDIGKMLADKLGYPFYDREITQMAAGTTGLSPAFIEKREESMTNSLLYDLVNQMYQYGNEKEGEEAPKDKIFEAESKVIRELAEQGKCVIIGRCSDYVSSPFNPCRTARNCSGTCSRGICWGTSVVPAASAVS